MTLTRLFASTAVALALGAAASLGISSGTLLSLLTQATIYAVFALGVGLLLRQNGMVSFGHALFFGCGRLRRRRSCCNSGRAGRSSRLLIAVVGAHGSSHS